MFGIAPHEVFEVRAAYLLFEFPNELNIDRSALLDRVPRAEQGGQRGAFIVGGAAAGVSIPFLVKYKWRPQPLGLVRRLNIEMVIYGYGRPVGSRSEFPDDYGVAGSRNFLCI